MKKTVGKLILTGKYIFDLFFNETCAISVDLVKL